MTTFLALVTAKLVFLMHASVRRAPLPVIGALAVLPLLGEAIYLGWRLWRVLHRHGDRTQGAAPVSGGRGLRPGLRERIVPGLRATQALRGDAGALLAAGRADEAFELYRMAMARTPRPDAQLLLDYARAARDAGHPALALRLIGQAHGRDLTALPVAARMTRARALEDLGRLAEAEAAYATLLAVWPDEEAAFRLAELMWRCGNQADARRAWSGIVDRQMRSRAAGESCPWGQRRWGHRAERRLAETRPWLVTLGTRDAQTDAAKA